MKNDPVTIIAGPCSVDEDNLSEIYQIAEITVNGMRAIAGTRVVGLKSRSELDQSGAGMGMDFSVVRENMRILQRGGSIKDMKSFPSTELAVEIYNKTNLLIATEIMIPSVQMPAFAGKFPPGKLMPWNPSVNQLGWNLLEIAEYAKENNWPVGIKNGKWIGENPQVADSESYQKVCPLEKVWSGLASYVTPFARETILIHRGVDVPEKGDFRNLPVHNIAKRTKLKTNAKLYFDPSHSYGPKMRENIVSATIDAMRMKIDEENYLYDGILIEAGTSKTDTEQHISLKELEQLAEEITTFRTLVKP